MKISQISDLEKMNSLSLKVLLVILLSAFVLNKSYAQGGANDSTFNVIDNGHFGNCREFSGGMVYSSVLQADGKIVSVGEFTEYNGKHVQNIIRINPDGSQDETFQTGSGFEQPAYHVALQQDGKILVSGTLYSYNGSALKGIVRLNSDGTRDTTFNCGYTFGNLAFVYSFVIQPDNKIIIGGMFNNDLNSHVDGITRLNSDGSVDSSYIIGAGFPNAVQCMELQSDGKLMVGGQFTTYDNATAKRIIRLHPDGTRDLSFNCDTLGAEVNALKIQPDGRILLGGYFAVSNGSPANHIIRLNTDGSIDTSFHVGSGLNGGPTYYVPTINTFHIKSDGKILAGGNFTGYQGVQANRILCLYPNGNRDTTFQLGGGFDLNVHTILAQNDEKLIVTGMFSNYNNHQFGGIIRLNSNATIDQSFSPGAGLVGGIKHMSVQPDDKLILVGNFSEYNGVIVKNALRLDPAGALDTTFKLENGLNLIPNTSYLQPDGKILIGGSYTNTNSVVSPALVRLNSDGSIDQSFTMGNTISGGLSLYAPGINAIQLQADGKIVAAGNFESYGGVVRRSVVRLNSDGTIDPTFIGPDGNSMTSNIQALTILDDGRFVIGGEAGIRIYRLNTDGSIDNTFNTGSGFGNGGVCHLDKQPDGKILVGGSFGIFNNVLQVQGLTRLNSDGTRDTTFHYVPGSTDQVWSFKQQADGRILICGDISSVDGIVRNKFARLTPDGALDTTFYIGHGFDATITSIGIQSDGKIIVGGGFTTYKGIYRSHLARLSICSSHSIHNVTACSSYTLNGQTYNSSGEYFQQLTNVAGCDSIIVLNLTIAAPDQIYIADTACSSYTWSANGLTFTQSGIYTAVLTNASGCDSTVTLNLTINQSNQVYISDTACSSYTWALNGQTYTQSGVYIDTLFNVLGCDSMVLLNLTINQPDLVTYTETTCSSYTWPVNGQVYTESGVYSDSLINSLGCDSIIMLNLTIESFQPTQVINSYIMPADSGSCNGKIALSFVGNNPYKISIDQADSVQIQNSTGYIMLSDLCPGIHDVRIIGNCSDTLYSQYRIPLSSNFIFNNAFIDSIAIDTVGYNLTNCTIDFSSVDTAFIDSISTNGYEATVFWNILDSSGLHLDTSIFVLNNGNGVYLLQLNVFCPNKTQGNYFSVTEAVYFSNGQAMGAGMQNLTEYPTISIVPNPTKDILKMQFSDSQLFLRITDTQGKLIEEKQITSGETISLINFQSGLYLFEFNSARNKVVKRVIKY